MTSAALKVMVEELLAVLDVHVGEVIVTDGHRTVIAIQSEDSKRLIGPHGEHLKALNMLARRMVEAKHGEDAANFLIDINGYQEAQLEGVRQNARMLAQRARLFKRDVELGPMTPYERLVIHELFATDPEIKTVSEGEGKFRHIVLKYQSTQQAPSY